MRITNDLIYLKRVYSFSPKFVSFLQKIARENDILRDLSWVIEAIQYVDRQDRNLEYYLFMKYGEAFISEIYLISNDPSKKE